MAMDDLEHESIRDRLHALRNGKSSGNGNGGFFKGIERHVRGLETWQLLLLGAGGVLVVDHLIAPKGMSFASKAMDKLSGSKPGLPPPPPPPPALSAPAAIAARGMYTGANNQAGWNRGMSDYFQWPGNVWQWKPHGGPWQNDWRDHQPWADFGTPEYPWAQ